MLENINNLSKYKENQIKEKTKSRESLLFVSLFWGSDVNDNLRWWGLLVKIGLQQNFVDWKFVYYFYMRKLKSKWRLIIQMFLFIFVMPLECFLCCKIDLFESCFEKTMLSYYWVSLIFLVPSSQRSFTLCSILFHSILWKSKLKNDDIYLGCDVIVTQFLRYDAKFRRENL